METNDKRGDGRGGGTAEEDLSKAVLELHWPNAALAFDDVDLESLSELRMRPGLEESIVGVLCDGPVALVRSVGRRLLGAGKVSTTQSVGFVRDRLLLAIFDANIRWMEEQRGVEDYLQSSQHFSRACRVPFLRDSQSLVLKSAFHDLVLSAAALEQRLGPRLEDAEFLQMPVTADKLVAGALKDADPGPWMRTALLGISSAPHFTDYATPAFESMLLQLSWPTLRAMWCLVFILPEVIPPSVAGYPYVSVRWILLASAPPPTDGSDDIRSNPNGRKSK